MSPSGSSGAGRAYSIAMHMTPCAPIVSERQTLYRLVRMRGHACMRAAAVV